MIPLCCELPVLLGGRTGALDNLLVTRDGGLVLVEAKLSRNPDARRSAVAQLLECAAAVFRMGYSELESAVLSARAVGKMPGAFLLEIVTGDSGEIDGSEFIDAVSRNLERGRAVIAEVGDGIREDIIPLANLVQSHAGHRFTFALVELAVYETPATGVRMVAPSVLEAKPTGPLLGSMPAIICERLPHSTGIRVMRNTGSSQAPQRTGQALSGPMGRSGHPPA